MKAPCRLLACLKVMNFCIDGPDLIDIYLGTYISEDLTKSRVERRHPGRYQDPRGRFRQDYEHFIYCSIDGGRQICVSLVKKFRCIHASPELLYPALPMHKNISLLFLPTQSLHNR